MKYVSDDGMTVEWLWNSRDGVTPFGILARDGATEIFHAQFYLDRYLPAYKPHAGERIFVDITPERCRFYLQKRIEHFWDHAEYPLREAFPSQATALDILFASEWREGGPDIILAHEWPHWVDPKGLK